MLRSEAKTFQRSLLIRCWDSYIKFPPARCNFSPSYYSIKQLIQPKLIREMNMWTYIRLVIVTCDCGILAKRAKEKQRSLVGRDLVLKAPTCWAIWQMMSSAPAVPESDLVHYGDIFLNPLKTSSFFRTDNLHDLGQNCERNVFGDLCWLRKAVGGDWSGVKVFKKWFSF